MRYEKINTKHRAGLLKRAVSLTLCAAFCRRDCRRG